ncbi:MAG: AAA family ATPase [Myxococcota bacterium]
MNTTLTRCSIRNPQGKMPVGISSFAQLLQGDYCFVDKTLFIQEILDAGDGVTLITRPRRFGKTINLSMLCAFLRQPAQKQNDLFDSLAISRQGMQYQQERGKRPVLFLSFRAVKESSWGDAYTRMQSLLSKLTEEVSRDGPVNKLAHAQQTILQRVIHQQASPVQCKEILAILTELLTLKHAGLTPWVVVDEYDTPMQAAYQYNYYKPMRNLMRGLLSDCLKENDYLHRGVVTGILRIAKEDIFSDLNNLGVYGVLDDPFTASFGFTTPEVQQLLQQRKLQHTFAAVSAWYDGYRFGEDRPVTVYNPWSLVNYAANPTRQPKEYWVNTGSTSLLQHLMSVTNSRDTDAIETLLLGNSIERDVADNLALRELEHLGEALWSIALTAGYVTATRTRQGTLGRKAMLRIPNREVRIAFQRMVLGWLNKVPNNTSSSLVQALLANDPEQFTQRLAVFVRATLSYFDVGASTAQPDANEEPLQPQPEHAYHMLMLGMLAHVADEYRIRSNRETGCGRSDVLLIPVDPAENRPGIIMEFKQVATQQNLQQAAQEALEQIQSKDYVAEFADHPPKQMTAYGIAFCGKATAVKHQTLTPHAQSVATTPTL